MTPKAVVHKCVTVDVINKDKAFSFNVPSSKGRRKTCFQAVSDQRMLHSLQKPLTKSKHRKTFSFSSLSKFGFPIEKYSQCLSHCLFWKAVAGSNEDSEAPFLPVWVVIKYPKGGNSRKTKWKHFVSYPWIIMWPYKQKTKWF